MKKKVIKYFFICIGIVIIIFILPIMNFFEKHYNKWQIQQNFVEFKIENPNDEIEIINKALKIYLDKMHSIENFNIYDSKKRYDFFYYEDIHDSLVDMVYRNCNGDNKYDDKCEFKTFDKRLDLEYLMKLGEKICINGEPTENAKEILKNDEILQNKKLFYPQDEKALVDENGNFITNFFYEGHYANSKNNGLFYSNIFLSKKYDNANTNKDFDIIIPIDKNFIELFSSGVKLEYPLGFCQKYNKIITSKENKEKLNFIFIPLKLTKNGAYDILTLEDIFYYRNIYANTNKTTQYLQSGNIYNEYNNIFNQYQTLKNNNFNKNLNLQGDGNAKNWFKQ